MLSISAIVLHKVKKKTKKLWFGFKEDRMV